MSAFLLKTDLHPPEKNARSYERRSTFDVRRSTFDVEYEYEYEYERSSGRRYLTFVATALSNKLSNFGRTPRGCLRVAWKFVDMFFRRYCKNTCPRFLLGEVGFFEAWRARMQCRGHMGRAHYGASQSGPTETRKMKSLRDLFFCCLYYFFLNLVQRYLTFVATALSNVRRDGVIYR